MVEWLEFSLRAWDRGGDEIAPAEFLDQLLIAPGDSATVAEGPGCPRVRLLSVALKDFDHVDITDDAGARCEAFAAAVRQGLIRAAGWLACQPPGLFEELRTTGRVTDIFVGGWIDQDQFDLDLPAEFLRACGVLGLSVSICTND
jgi:hypothetical protein